MTAHNTEAQQLTEALAKQVEAGPKQSRTQSGHGSSLSSSSSSSSSHCTVLILGATGNTGSATVKSLYTYFRHQLTIRLGVRDIEKAKKQLTGFRGLEIVRADTSDPSTLKHALTGVDAVFITAPGNGNGRAEAVTTIIDAVKSIGTVKFILFTGVATTGNQKFIFGREFGKYYEQLKTTGIPFCWLKLPMFCENFWGNIPTIKSNKAIYAPIAGDRHFHYVSVNDIGLASAFILADYSRHFNTSYLLTGPETTSHTEILKVLQPIVGDISFHTSTKEQTVDAITKAMGVPAWQAEGIVELWEYSANSSDGVDGRAISKDFEKLTGGKKPTSYAQFIQSIAYALSDKFAPPPTPTPLPTVLITGATGNVGTWAVKSLHSIYGSKVHVLAGVRDKEKGLKTFASLQGLELVYVDTNNPSSLDRALNHVDSVFIIPPNPGANTDRKISTLAQIDAAKRAGVKFILLLDVLVSGDDKYILGHEWNEYIKAVQATGIPHTRLISPMFAENIWGSIGSLKGQGAFYYPVGGDIQYSYATVQDVGTAAAAILADPSKHAGKTYVITGPSLTTNNTIATELSKLTGREIKFYQATPEQAITAMTGMGFPEWQAKGVVELWDFHTLGKGRAVLVSDDYKTLTGTSSTDIKDFLKHLVPAIKA